MQLSHVFPKSAQVVHPLLSPQHQQWHHPMWLSLMAEEAVSHARTLLMAPAPLEDAVKGTQGRLH